ncbi:MAG: hypothetical protein U1A27_08190 [Phycisphaerae bacterium]
MKRRRILWALAGVCTAGCGLVQDLQTLFLPITPPGSDMQLVIGGLSDLRPYFGGYSIAERPNEEAGQFLLGSCGCGDWRVLFQPYDGSGQTQFPVRFFSFGPYSTDTVVQAYGTEDNDEVLLDVNQPGGLTGGRARFSGQIRAILAKRGDSHVGQPVDACILCHVGDDPIFPLPAWHPQKYKTNPRVCLECHSANGE